MTYGYDEPVPAWAGRGSDMTEYTHETLRVLADKADGRRLTPSECRSIDAHADAWKAQVLELEVKMMGLYPPGARYLNNPLNMNDPRILDDRGEVVEP